MVSEFFHIRLLINIYRRINIQAEIYGCPIWVWREVETKETIELADTRAPLPHSSDCLRNNFVYFQWCIIIMEIVRFCLGKITIFVNLIVERDLCRYRYCDIISIYVTHITYKRYKRYICEQRISIWIRSYDKIKRKYVHCRDHVTTSFYQLFFTLEVRIKMCNNIEITLMPTNNAAPLN